MPSTYTHTHTHHDVAVAQSVGHSARKSEDLGSIPVLATYFRFSADSRGAVVSYWQKYVHKALVNRLGSLSLPRKSVVRLIDRPDMTLDVYRGRKTTTQQQQQIHDITKSESRQPYNFALTRMAACKKCCKFYFIV